MSFIIPVRPNPLFDSLPKGTRAAIFVGGVIGNECGTFVVSEDGRWFNVGVYRDYSKLRKQFTGPDLMILEKRGKKIWKRVWDE